MGWPNGQFEFLRRDEDKHPEAPITKMQRFLLNYRTTPHTTTLNFLKPKIRKRVENRQKKCKHYHDSYARGRTFIEGDAIIVKSFQSG